jgi:hypothetical protein
MLLNILREQEKIMIRLFCALAIAAGLTGCVVAPPPPSYGYGYGYEPAPAYGYAPGYYAAPTVNLGIGIGGYWGGHGGWHGR